MKPMKTLGSILLTLCLGCSLCTAALAATFTDAHGNEIELDETLEAYAGVTLRGAQDAARQAETNLGDLWTDALRWFATSGRINSYFEEDDVTAGNASLAVDAAHTVALWNGGNLRADIPEGKFGAAELAAVLPYPNRVAVVYLSGAELLEALEAAAQGLPYSADSAEACASFMQVSGLVYTVAANRDYDRGEAYNEHWYEAASVQRVRIESVNGQAFDAAATYAVVTSNANFNGMDASYVFARASAADARSAITTAVVRDVVWMYIAEELGNTVDERYREAQGRITIEAAAPETADEAGSGAQEGNAQEGNAQEPAAQTPQPGGTYTVQRGDSLWKIAARAYGRGTLWGRLYEANAHIQDPALIYVGQTLTIPAL